MTKAFILLFQLQRYYLCFVQDFVKKPTYIDSVKLKMNIFTILFYIITIIGIIMTLVVIGTVIIVLVSKQHDLYSWQGIWCTWIPHEQTARYAGYLMLGGSLFWWIG